MNQRIVLAEGMRQVLDAFPLNAVHIEVQIDYMARALQGFCDLGHSPIAQLIEAEIVRCNSMVHHHELPGQNARRMLLKVAV